MKPGGFKLWVNWIRELVQPHLGEVQDEPGDEVEKRIQRGGDDGQRSRRHGGEHLDSEEHHVGPALGLALFTTLLRIVRVKTHSTDDSQYGPWNQSDTREWSVNLTRG